MTKSQLTDNPLIEALTTDNHFYKIVMVPLTGKGYGVIPE